jgi:hypothetical protein
MNLLDLAVKVSLKSREKRREAREIISIASRPDELPSDESEPARVGRIDRSVECPLQVIMPQAEICSVVETFTSPIFILHRLAAKVRKPVTVGFLR